jgi:uncharacterized protein (TIGR02246 family)
MKNALKLIMFMLCCTSLRAQTADDEKKVLNVLDEQVAGWNSGNIDAFMKGYWNNDSVMYVGKNGITYGYNTVLKKYKQTFPDTVSMGKLSFNILHVKPLSPEYFFVTGKYILKRTKGDAQGHFTLVFRKIDDQWLIISDHSS